MGTEARTLTGTQGRAFVGVGRAGAIAALVESTDQPDREIWNPAEVEGKVVVIFELDSGVVTEAQASAKGEGWVVAKARDAATEGAKVRITVPAKTAVAATQDTPNVACPFAGTVSAVTYEPASLLTGADTNSLTLSLINKGQAGAGSTVVATKAFTNGVNAAATPTQTTLTVQGGGADAVAKGDLLSLRQTKVGTGLADPGGTIRITITPA